MDIAEEYPDCELLSLKPVIYAANLDEDGFADPHGVEYYRQVEERAQTQGAQVIPVCAKLEAEIAELDPEEKKMFLDDLGIAESGLDRLVKASYSLLGLRRGRVPRLDHQAGHQGPPGRRQDPL